MGWLRARFTVLDTPPMQVYASEKRSQPSQNECANHVGNAHNLRCHINKEIGQPAPHACRCSIAPRFMSRHRAMSSIQISMIETIRYHLIDMDNGQFRRIWL